MRVYREGGAMETLVFKKNPNDMDDAKKCVLAVAQNVYCLSTYVDQQVPENWDHPVAKKGPVVGWLCTRI